MRGFQRNAPCFCWISNIAFYGTISIQGASSAFLTSKVALNQRKATTTPPRCAPSAISRSEKDYEDALKEMESEKLYGLGSRDAEIDQFASWLNEGKLNLFPEYQREYVWKPKKSSRLLATVLGNRYVPPVVLHERKKGNYDVVDGKQRLMSILGFYLNRSNAEKPSDHEIREKIDKHLPSLEHLENLDESYERINGLKYDYLIKERKDAFRSYSITYAIIPYGTPKTDVFEVYEDINSGGENLKPQQVRRAVYFGPYIKLLDALAETCQDFHAIRVPKKFRKGSYATCPTHSDRELILRAFAFKQKGDQFKMPLKKFLNRELDGSDDFEERDQMEQQRVTEKLDQLRNEFSDVMKVALSVFEDGAFRKWERKNSPDFAWSTKISLSLWGAAYSALAELLIEFKPVQFTEAKGSIVQSLKNSFENGFFAEDDGKESSSKNFLARKDEFKRLVSDAIREQAYRDPRRSFPKELRRPLYEAQEGKCGICGQLMEERRIDEEQYVHVDHIKPHSQGGKTVRENAQLVHRECNAKKGARFVK